MSRVAIKIKEKGNYWIGRGCHIDIVDNHLEIKPKDKSRTYQILFPNGVEESTLEVLMGEILNTIEIEDDEKLTIVIKQLKDFSDKDRRQFLGDTTDLYLDENLFVVYIDETYQREIFVFPKVEVKVC